jgi:hypothetical protein
LPEEVAEGIAREREWAHRRQQDIYTPDRFRRCRTPELRIAQAVYKAREQARDAEGGIAQQKNYR